MSRTYYSTPLYLFDTLIKLGLGLDAIIMAEHRASYLGERPERPYSFDVYLLLELTRLIPQDFLPSLIPSLMSFQSLLISRFISGSKQYLRVMDRTMLIVQK
jgi:hypothetical protein